MNRTKNRETHEQLMRNMRALYGDKMDVVMDGRRVGRSRMPHPLNDLFAQDYARDAMAPPDEGEDSSDLG